MKRELTYLAIGDSLTAGNGAPPDHGFVHQYVRLTERSLGHPVRAVQAGKSGATTNEILQVVRTQPHIRLAAEDASVITVTAGGNDLIQAAKKFYFESEVKHLMSALKLYQRNMGSILDEIMRLKTAGTAPYMLRVIGLYNPLPEFEEAVFWVHKFNEHLRSFASGNVHVIDVDDAFLGRENELLSDDRFHPNAEGYRVMAEKVHLAGYAPIAAIIDA